MQKIKIIITSLFILSFIMNRLFGQILNEDRQRIETAIPKKAIVQPKKPRKLLIVTLHKRDGKVISGHTSIPYGNFALALMGKRTGAYQTVFSNDTLMFRADSLNQFDAICFNNTAGVLFNNAKLRQNLLNFVANGKGFVGIHAAAATFVQWPRYDQFPAYGGMIGAYENGGHPWKPHEWITIRVEEPDHPLNAMFKQIDFPISDEVLQFQAPYSRKKLRVLLQINTNQTDMSEDRYILPERRQDLDLAMSWIRNYGTGRVFYCSFGHNPHIFWNTPVLEHYLAGIQFALGDLEADATPSNKK